MKLQDLVFLAGFIVLIFFRRPKISIIIGLMCFTLAMPLFGKMIFFTAERLIYYGAAFIALGTVGLMVQKNENRN